MEDSTRIAAISLGVGITTIKGDISLITFIKVMQSLELVYFLGIHKST